MTSKEKVLKLKPTAKGYKIHEPGQLAKWIVNIDGVCYGYQRNESWSWAEALRILTNPIYN